MNERRISVTRVIPASPEQIFAVLSDASLHAVIDGSSTVQHATGTPEPLEQGSRFGMSMRLGFIPYLIRNEVVEFDPPRRIAWRHFGKHIWRYELEPADSGTRVTETFDWSTSVAPRLIELAGYPQRHPANMERTLERLEAFVTNRTAAT